MITKTVIIKSKTNDELPAKQYFTLIKGTCNDALLIEKLVLVPMELEYQHYFKNHKILRRFKNYSLVKKEFSIKIDTITKALLNLIVND